MNFVSGIFFTEQKCIIAHNMLKRLRLENEEKGINVFKYFLNVLFALLEEIFPVLVPQLTDTVSFFGTPFTLKFIFLLHYVATLSLPCLRTFNCLNQLAKFLLTDS